MKGDKNIPGGACAEIIHSARQLHPSLDASAAERPLFSRDQARHGLARRLASWLELIRGN
jgi:hypothetical protein